VSISDEFFEYEDNDDKALFETIKDSLDILISEGLIEVCGIEPNGEWRYKATPKGQKFVKENKTFSDIEGLEEL